MNVPLPFEIQEEILKRVPDVKSLLQFRSVSKSWKSLIDSPQFVADYRPQPRRHHMFVWYEDHKRYFYVSNIDNDDDSDSDSGSFARHSFPLSIPISVGPHDGFRVYGGTQGLFCLYDDFPKGIAVLLNHSIRKSVTINVPKVSYNFTMGFGVSPYSSDPKLVRIQSVVDVSDDLKSRRVEIYSLSTGEWRTLSEDLPRSSVVFDDHQVAIGNFIVWFAYEKGMGMEREMIMLFDMISEKFMEIYVPIHVLPNDPNHESSLFEIRESLAAVVPYFDYSVKKQFVHVWVMEGGVSDSFTKMYSIIRPDEYAFSLLAFRNNGHPIIQMNDDKFESSDKLVVYEPVSEQFTSIGPSRCADSWYASSCMETLLLLDQ